MVIRSAAWRPRPSGRGGNAASPPRKCRCCPIVCSHVPVPTASHPRPGNGAAGPLRARPVCVEPGRRAARPLAPRPERRAGLPGAVRQLTQARAEYPWLAAGSQTVQQQALRDFSRAMTAFYDPGNPAGAAVVAQGRPGRGIPDNRAARAAMGRAPRIPPRRPGLGAQGRVGAVPMVPRGAAGSEVLPGEDGPRRALACRLRGRSRAGPGARHRRGGGH